MSIRYVRRSRRPAPGRGAVTLSASVHMALIAAAWASNWLGPRPLTYETIAITLVEPPPVLAQETVEAPADPEELVVETPEPEPEEEPPPEQTEEVTPPPETPQSPPEEPEEEPRETTSPDATREEGPSGEDLDVVMEGLRRDYPAYYENIIRQINRCFRPPAVRATTTLRFRIARDGTVSDIETVQSSGSIPLEIAAIEAVECAGQGRFGPLPEDFPWDMLPVEFNFEPRGGPEEP